MKVAQEALGHASIASTGIYTQMSREAYTAELHAIAGTRMRLRDARAQAAAGAAL
jgi:site-specific recombinase XerC